jgi:hypothetical protein
VSIKRPQTFESTEELLRENESHENIQHLRHLQSTRLMLAEIDLVASKKLHAVLQDEVKLLQHNLDILICTVQNQRQQYQAQLMSDIQNIATLNQWHKVEVALNRSVELARGNLDELSLQLASSECNMRETIIKKFKIDLRMAKLDELHKLYENK